MVDLEDTARGRRILKLFGEFRLVAADTDCHRK
jgi:hypothetical protein